MTPYRQAEPLEPSAKPVHICQACGKWYAGDGCGAWNGCWACAAGRRKTLRGKMYSLAAAGLWLFGFTYAATHQRHHEVESATQSGSASQGQVDQCPNGAVTCVTGSARPIHVCHEPELHGIQPCSEPGADPSNCLLTSNGTDAP